MSIDRIKQALSRILSLSPRRSGRRGLRLQLLLILTISLSPLLALSLAQGLIEFREERAAQADRFRSVLMRATDEFEAELQRSSGVAETLASYPDLPDLRGRRCDDTLRALRAVQPNFANIRRIAADGTVLCAAEATDESADLLETAWFQRMLAGEVATLSGIYLDWALHRPVMTVARRLERDAGFGGVIAIDLDVRTVLDLLRNQELPAEMGLALVDAQGNLSYVSELPEADRLARLPEDMIARVRATGQPVLAEQLEASPGRAVLVAPLPGRDLQLALSAPSSLFGRWAGFDIVGTVLVPVLMWLLALLAVSLAVDYFVLGWLSYLGRLARLYGSGRLGVKPIQASRAPREIRELADVMAAMARDLDVRSAELENLADQRGALLREIHHRVKNNLQVTMSLLNLQARRTSDAEARRVLTEARSRIYALALVHRTLYENDDLRMVDMAPFLEHLLSYLREASGSSGAQVTLRVAVDAVSLDPDQAIPVALLVTEAVTNAFKYAFSEGQSGEVVVGLERESDDRVCVSVRDNGRGFDTGAAGSGGMGTSLMSALASRLGGTLERGAAEDGGAVVQVYFKPE
jgi:two-component sensor histidine kinase